MDKDDGALPGKEAPHHTRWTGNAIRSHATASAWDATGRRRNARTPIEGLHHSTVLRSPEMATMEHSDSDVQLLSQSRGLPEYQHQEHETDNHEGSSRQNAGQGMNLRVKHVLLPFPTCRGDGQSKLTGHAIQSRTVTMVP